MAAPPVPKDLERLVLDVSAWDAKTRQTWQNYQRHSVFRRSVGLGTAIGDAIRLQRAIRTHRIDAWLATAPPDTVTSFDAWRDAFFARCDALAALATAGLVASGLAMPEDGMLTMAVHNPARLGRLISGRPSFFATLGVYLGTTVLVAREWDFFSSFAARQLRRAGVPLSTGKISGAMRRLNANSDQPLITRRHGEALHAAYEALAERGVSGEAADRLVRHALEWGRQASGENRGRVSAVSLTS